MKIIWVFIFSVLVLAVTAQDRYGDHIDFWYIQTAASSLPLEKYQFIKSSASEIKQHIESLKIEEVN